MTPFEHPQHDLNALFAEIVRDAARAELGRALDHEIEHYLAQLLIRFLHTDQIFRLRNSEGKQLIAISEMLPEGDISLNAASFEQERVVHRHIGDFLLFWSGLYPEFLRRIKLEHGGDVICDYPRQGQQSYHLVSTFDYPPHDQEAPIFRQLSEEFEAYTYALRGVRQKLDHRSIS